MIPNGEEMTWHGHHLVFESEPDQCRGCFFEDKDSCPDCDEGAWVEQKSNPWHTGTPTEEGDYLVAVKYPVLVDVEYEINRFLLKPYNSFIYETEGEGGIIIAWQKIEPYKEKDK